jgi:glyoxylase-like metal-dependent hydrolase (beta-lactamase superfamily II)
MRPGFFVYPMATRTLPPATHTNAFLVGSGEMVLVDPGGAGPDEAARLLAFIDQLGTEGRRVAEIWLTHHHSDHAGGVAALARALNVPVRAHPETAARLAGGPVTVDGSLVEGVVRVMDGLPGWRLRVLHTPGHAPGHLAFLEEKSGSLIAGDMVAASGTVLVDPPDGDMIAYLASLRRLREIDATAIFPAHGAPTAGVRALLDGCLARRLDRESRVLAALAGGAARTIDEMLPEVYGDVDISLHRPAARTLLAHLLKLVAEGRALAEGERYRAV